MTNFYYNFLIKFILQLYLNFIYIKLNTKNRPNKLKVLVFKRKLVYDWQQKTGYSKDMYGNTPPCINSTASTNYLNRMDVRSALHIEPSLPKWDVCKSVVCLSFQIFFGLDYSFILKIPAFCWVLLSVDLVFKLNNKQKIY